MKTCTTCKIEKELTDFSKDSKKTDGLQYNCKSCNASYRAANRDRISAWGFAYRAKNPEKIRVQQAKSYISSREYRLKKASEYRSKNIDKVRARDSAYKSANPEKIAGLNRNRRAKKSNAEGRHSAAEIRKIFDSQRGLCANCQIKLFKSGKQKYHVDHIMPLALGGSNWPSNLQCLCPSCNMRKNAKDPYEWAKENGRLI